MGRAPPTGEVSVLTTGRTNRRGVEYRKYTKEWRLGESRVEGREREREGDTGMEGKREPCIINPFAS